MSEVTVGEGVEPTTAATQGRGRPRPDVTVQRDKVVLEYITANGPQSRKQIAEGTSIAGKEVYLSLYRLSRADPPAIEKRGSTWVVAGYVSPEQPVA